MQRLLALWVLGCTSVWAAHPLETLKPGHWYEAPDSQLRAVAAKVSPSAEMYGNSGVAGVIDSWSGGAFDSKRNQLLVWGGGHRAYGGNEVYAFDVESLRWQRLTEPSSVAGYKALDDIGVLADGTPRARHTYSNLLYLPEPYDVLWAQGGAVWPSGGLDRNTWALELASKQWHKLERAPVVSSNGYAAWDAFNKRIVYRGGKSLLLFNPKTGKWNNLGRRKNFWDDRSVAIDAKRGEYVVIGHGEMWSMSLDGGFVEGRVQSQGATEILKRRAPGFQYVKALDRFVAWSGGTEVFSFQPGFKQGSGEWFRHSPAPGNQADPGAAAKRGTYGRFQYVPKYNVFVVVNSVDKNVFFYKLDVAAGKATAKVKPKPEQGAGAKAVTIKGTGQSFNRPSQAAKVARDGDVIEIRAGTYRGDVALWTQNNLTLRGVGGRVQLLANGKSVGGKAIWIIRGDNVTVENIEFVGARVRDRNGAGIRHEGNGLTIRNCGFFNNQNGILGGRSKRNDILVEYSEFARNGGGDGKTHNIYIGAARSLTFRYNSSHHAKVGHNLKSRAAKNIIENNLFFDDRTGNASYAIDLPSGGVGEIRHNLVQQGPKTENWNLISYGTENMLHRDNSLIVEGNILIDQQGKGGKLVRARNVKPVVRNNIEVRKPK